MNPNSTSHTANSIVGRMASILRRFTEPAPAIQDVDLRHKSRLLSTLLLIMTVIFIGVDIIYFLTVPGYIPPWYGYAFLGTAYFLNRTKYYTWAAVLTIAMFPIVIFSLVLTNKASEPVVTLTYLILSLILGSIFLSIRGTAILAGVNLIGILLMPVLARAAIPEFSMIVGPLSTTAIGAALVLVLMIHRNHIERDRQAELHRNEERLRLALDAAHMGTWNWDILTDNITWSEQVESIFGLETGKFADTYEVYRTLILPEDLSLVEKAIAAALTGETANYQVEHRITWPDGSIRWLEGKGRVYRDKAKRPSRMTGTVVDITQRKEAEQKLKAYSERLREMVAERTRKLEDAQERLIRQERLVVLGQLAGGVGHELRNPLGVITNAIYFLQMVLTDADETIKEYLNLITERVAEADKIVSDLLNLSRNRTADRTEVTVSELVDEVLIRHPAPKKVTTVLKIPSDLPALFVDSQQIRQVLANLVTNAYQAMPNGGRLTISAHLLPKTVRLSVVDTGTGMSLEVVEKIFEPLYTTKAKGIGLGLAISKNLVDVNGGTIDVASVEGQGSTFTVVLPSQQ